MTLRLLFATPIYDASLSTDRSFENFRAELEAACRIEPDVAEYRYKLGLAWNDLGDSTRTIAALEVTLMRVPPDTNVHAEKLPDSKPSAKMLSIDGVAVLVEVGSGVEVLVSEGITVGKDVAVKVGRAVDV